MTKEDTLKKVGQLTDSQVIEVLKEVHAKVFSAVEYQDVLNNAVLAADDDVQYLVNLDTETKGAQKDLVEAGETARTLLLYMVQDDEFAKIIDDAIAEVESSEHLSIVAAIVAVGLLVNLTILVSTTEIKYIDGKISIVKGVAPTSLVKTILTPVKALAGSVV